MQTEIVIAGFGGQGVLFAGQMLSYAAADNGLETTWFPSYGPEMRGGTANCTVIIADEEIGAPVVRNPQAALVMNLPSLDKFEKAIKPGGVLIVNASLVTRPVTRTDLTVINIPANQLAEALGSKQLVNVVMIGALLAHLPVLSFEDVKTALELHLPKRKHHLLDANYTAIDQGAKFAQDAVTT